MNPPSNWRKVWQLTQKGVHIADSRPNAQLVSILARYAPRKTGTIPKSVLAECFRVASTVPGLHTSRRKQIAVGLAIAAGWHRREVREVVGAGNWNKPWPEAEKRMINRMSRVIGQVLREFTVGRLSRSTKGAKDLVERGPVDHAYDYALQIRGLFLDRTEAVKPMTKPKYRRNWFLENWSPEQSLQAHIRRAVYGQERLRAPFKVNTFRQGLLYHKLSGKMDIRRLALKVCCECGVSIRYEDQMHCGYYLRPDMFLVREQDFLVVPGEYVEKTDGFRRFVPANIPTVVRNHVPKSYKFYFEESLGECPHNATHISQNKTSLWVTPSEAPRRVHRQGYVINASDDPSRSAEVEPIDNNEPLKKLIARERDQTLEKALERLSKALSTLNREYREIITKYYIMDMKISEISRSMGYGRGRVEGILERARNLLKLGMRESLPQEGPEP